MSSAPPDQLPGRPGGATARSTPRLSSGTGRDRAVAGARWTPVRRLAGGAEASAVWLVEDPGGRRALRKRFGDAHGWLRELAVASSVHDDRIVRRIGTRYAEDDDPELLYAWVEGGDLAGHLRARGSLGPDAVAHLLRDVLLALAHLHGRGWVHADVKPANLLYDASHARWVLADLGSARTPGRSGVGLGAGTPAYAAPERLSGQLDPRTDLYALGVVAFEALTGALPFDGGPREVLRAHVTQAPRLDRLPEGRVSRLVADLLRKDPADRPPSAASALAQLDGEGSGAFHLCFVVERHRLRAADEGRRGLRTLPWTPAHAPRRMAPRRACGWPPAEGSCPCRACPAGRGWWTRPTG